MDKPYEGLFVLDAGQGVAGPYCGLMLAAAGAEVVKLEPPEGDWSRGLGTRQGTQSVLHAVYNRGKKSVVLDLRDPAARPHLAALAARADVLIESFRPGVAARIGLGPDAAKSDAVCLSVSGFGQQGPYAERPCTDSVAQAQAAMMVINRDEAGTPRKVGTIVSDLFTGLHGFASVQAALAARARDAAEGRPPKRRVLDLSLMAGTAAMLSFGIAEAGLLGHLPAALNVPAGCYQGADGAWFSLALVRENEYAALCEVVERPDLAADPRFADFPARAVHRDALLPELRLAFAARTADVWLDHLAARRLLASRVNGPLEWLADPHVRAVGGAAVLEQPGLGALPLPVIPAFPQPGSPAPALGQHTDAVLGLYGAPR